METLVYKNIFIVENGCLDSIKCSSHYEKKYFLTVQIDI